MNTALLAAALPVSGEIYPTPHPPSVAPHEFRAAMASFEARIEAFASVPPLTQKVQELESSLGALAHLALPLEDTPRFPLLRRGLGI